MSDAYDRRSERREDDAWLEQTWSAEGTRVLTIAGTRLRTSDGLPEWTTVDRAPDGVRLFLGAEGDRATFAVIVPPDRAADGSWVNLRAVAAAVGGDDLRYLMHAVGLAEWHWAVRHCPRCGGPLRAAQAGHVLRCTVCGRDHFPRTDPAVIMLVTDEEDRALLGRQSSWPRGRWSTLAGFVEPGETLEDAVRREVREESGVGVGEVAYAGSQPWPLPASLMLGFTARAVEPAITVDGAELEDARWWSREEARAAAEEGTLLIPPGISISRWLITTWYGADDLPGSWT